MNRLANLDWSSIASWVGMGARTYNTCESYANGQSTGGEAMTRLGAEAVFVGAKVAKKHHYNKVTIGCKSGEVVFRVVDVAQVLSKGIPANRKLTEFARALSSLARSGAELTEIGLRDYITRLDKEISQLESSKQKGEEDICKGLKERNEILGSLANLSGKGVTATYSFEGAVMLFAWKELREISNEDRAMISNGETKDPILSIVDQPKIPKELHGDVDLKRYKCKITGEPVRYAVRVHGKGDLFEHATLLEKFVKGQGAQYGVTSKTDIHPDEQVQNIIYRRLMIYERALTDCIQEILIRA